MVVAEYAGFGVFLGDYFFENPHHLVLISTLALVCFG